MSKQNISEKDYSEFVDQLTGPCAKDEMAFTDRMTDLTYDLNFKEFPRLAMGAIGLVDEAAEVLGILKKVMFQGKQLDDETLTKLHREVGDARYYLEELYIALGMEDGDARENNYDKLSKRYDNGVFEVEKSENRKPGDT